MVGFNSNDVRSAKSDVWRKNQRTRPRTSDLGPRTSRCSEAGRGGPRLPARGGYRRQQRSGPRGPRRPRRRDSEPRHRLSSILPGEPPGRAGRATGGRGGGEGGGAGGAVPRPPKREEKGLGIGKGRHKDRKGGIQDFFFNRREEKEVKGSHPAY